jgi:phosphopantetheinyl transferase
MESSIFDLETGLKKQLVDLADDIRTIETSLMVSKEAYLKVQGALEILDILRKKVKEDDAALKAALSDIGAD